MPIAPNSTEMTESFTQSSALLEPPEPSSPRRTTGRAPPSRRRPLGPDNGTSVHTLHPLRMEVYGQTDTGRLRESNEDSFAVLPEFGLFMLADGMGGAACGEVASKMAIDSVREMFERVDPDWPSVDTTRPSAVEPPSSRLPGARLLVAGVRRANSRILDAARRDPTKKGMGTTFAGVLALQDRIVIANVGDSRVYRLRERRLELLSEDHTLVNEFIRAGLLDPAEAESFPHRNVITRAVGAEEKLEVDTRIDTPLPGDVYLLCSDGLSEMVGHDELASILLENPDVTQAAPRLIERANDYGGPDNITAVLMKWVSASAPSR